MSINFNNNSKKIDSILLAAGKSSRMGEDKALLRIGEKLIINMILRKLAKFSKKIHIILGDNFREVKSIVENSNPGLNKIEFVFNENHQKGMFASIKKGFSRVSGDNFVLLQMIDQPFISENVYQILIQNLDNIHLVFQPYCVEQGRNRRGHPLIFSNKFSYEYLEKGNYNTLREVLKELTNRSKLITVEEKSIYHNINEKRDFRQILKERKNGNTDIPNIE